MANRAADSMAKVCTPAEIFTVGSQRPHKQCMVHESMDGGSKMWGRLSRQILDHGTILLDHYFRKPTASGLNSSQTTCSPIELNSGSGKRIPTIPRKIWSFTIPLQI